MKKVIFGTALASMALLSACSSDNELANVGTTANNAIGFHVVGNKAETRANIIDTSEKSRRPISMFLHSLETKMAAMVLFSWVTRLTYSVRKA